MDTTYNNREAAFKNILNDMFDTYRKKNADYGNSFDSSLNEFGEIAGIVRIADKFNRLKNISLNGNANFESENDTLLDLANYAIMLLLWRLTDNTQTEKYEN